MFKQNPVWLITFINSFDSESINVMTRRGSGWNSAERLKTSKPMRCNFLPFRPNFKRNFFSFEDLLWTVVYLNKLIIQDIQI